MPCMAGFLLVHEKALPTVAGPHTNCQVGVSASSNMGHHLPFLHEHGITYSIGVSCVGVSTLSHQ